ncbi:MAG: hypothetical protein ACTJGG_13460 [Marinomonas foliarum]
MSENNQKNRLWDIVVLAAAVTILGIGYSVGQGHANGLIAYLKEVNSQQKSEIETLNSEVAKLEREVALKPIEIASKSNFTSSKAEAANNEAKAKIESEINDLEFYQEIGITSENSVRLFNGELIISVAGIKYQGAPLRDTVYGTIGGLGHENIELKGESPGFVTNFNGFEVRILSTSTFSAKFGVTKIEKANKQS